MQPRRNKSPVAPAYPMLFYSPNLRECLDFIDVDVVRRGLDWLSAGPSGRSCTGGIAPLRWDGLISIRRESGMWDVPTFLFVVGPGTCHGWASVSV
jgi:hypothetical protein